MHRLMHRWGYALVALAAVVSVSVASAQDGDEDLPDSFTLPLKDPYKIPGDNHQSCESCKADVVAVGALRKRIEERKQDYAAKRGEADAARAARTAIRKELRDLRHAVETFTCTRQGLEKLADAKGIADLEKEFAEKCSFTAERASAKLKELEAADPKADAAYQAVQAARRQLAGQIQEALKLLASLYERLDDCETRLCKKPSPPRIAERPPLPECFHYKTNVQAEMKKATELVEAFIRRVKAEEDYFRDRLKAQPAGAAWNIQPFLDAFRTEIAWGQKLLDGGLWEIRDCDAPPQTSAGQPAGGAGGNRGTAASDPARPQNAGDASAAGGSTGCAGGEPPRSHPGIVGKIQGVNEQIQGAGCR